MAGFAALGLPDTIVQALAEMGYAEPTSVQTQGIPPLLAGKDVLLEAQTGSGKTAAFGGPAVVVGSQQPGLRALILVPTRELARQVADELREIGKGSPFRAVAVTGGVHAEKEERTLGGDVRCVIATPGRLLALLESRKVRLDKVELLVLDEADRMLDMGFLTEVEKVLAATAGRKQTALVSATLPRGVVRLAEKHLRDAVAVKAHREALPPTLQHHRLNVLDGEKEAATIALMKKENPDRAIVFVRTRQRASAFAKLLKSAGFAADPLQGDMSHEQRRHVFDLFSRGTTKILVATDIASRGLDVPEMQLVVNVDLPDEDDAYTHRAGRAARLGRDGKVVSLVLPAEKNRRIELERESGAEWMPYRLTFDKADVPPDPKEVAAAARKASTPRAPPRPAARAPPRPSARTTKARKTEPKGKPAPARGPKPKQDEPRVPDSRKGRSRR